MSDFTKGQQVRVIDADHAASRFVTTVDSVNEETGEVTLFRHLTNDNKETWTVSADRVSANPEAEPRSFGTEEQDNGEQDEPPAHVQEALTGQPVPSGENEGEVGIGGDSGNTTPNLFPNNPPAQS